jgi:hypothetical protein
MLLRILRGLGAVVLVPLGLAALVLAVGLVVLAAMALTGPAAALAVYLWEMLPDVLLYPRLLALGMVVVAVTAAAAAQGASGRGEARPGEASAGCLLPFMVVPALLLHLFPALLLVLLVQEVWLAVPVDWKDPAEFALLVFLPAAKVGVLFSFAGNFADLASLAGAPPLRRHLGQFLLALAPAYYGMLAVAAGVGSLLAAFLAPPFQPLVPLGRLMAPPRVAPSPALNAVLLVVLVAGTALVSFALRRNRAAAGATAAAA